MATKSKKKKTKLKAHLTKLGFSNRLAVYILIFLLLGLIGGFILAIMSIKTQFDGALYCWTIVFTPIGTAVSIVLSRIVDKSRAENTVGGIKYETALITEPPILEQSETAEEFVADSIDTSPII